MSIKPAEGIYISECCVDEIGVVNRWLRVSAIDRNVKGRWYSIKRFL